MSVRLTHIGFGNIIAVNRVLSLLSVNQQPVKRYIKEARTKGLLIDATHGRRTRSIIISDSNHVILSAIQPETIAQRFRTSMLEIEKLLIEIREGGGR